MDLEPNENLKKNIINKLKLLYDRNSSRSIKRTEQINRIRSSKSVSSEDFKNLDFKKPNIFNNEEDNCCSSKQLDSLSNTYREKSKRDLSCISDQSLINKGDNCQQYRDDKDLDILNPNEKSNLENSNQNNITSLNITYINNIDNISASKDKYTINNLDNKLMNVNIKNNKLLLCESDNHSKKNSCFKTNDKKTSNNNSNQVSNKNGEIHNETIINCKKNNDNDLQNAILNVSDLDIEMEEEENNLKFDGDNVNHIFILKNINNKNSSFVNFKNNLKTKSDLEDNKTQSYLMALHGYLDEKDDYEQEDNIDFNQYINKDSTFNTKHNTNNSGNVKLKNTLIENFCNKEVEIDNNDKENEYNNIVDNLESSNPHISRNNNQVQSFNCSKNLIKNCLNENNDLNNKNNNSDHHRTSGQNTQQTYQQGHTRSKSQEVSTNNFRVPSVNYFT